MMTAASSYKDTVGSGYGVSLFKDVKSSHWASEYIRLVVEQNWMTGYTDGTFRPGRTITLEEACTALLRLLGQYREEMRRDYVTGVYNRAFLDSAYRKKVAAAACAGKPVSVVAARVNEYWNLLREEGTHAADCCLNTAAGILQLAAGPDQQNAVVRLEDGIFLVVSVGTPAAKLQAALHEALGESRRTFGITLSRRGEFTVSLSSADWGEAGSWDLMVALAEQRLSGG